MNNSCEDKKCFCPRHPITGQPWHHCKADIKLQDRISLLQKEYIDILSRYGNITKPSLIVFERDKQRVLVVEEKLKALLG